VLQCPNFWCRLPPDNSATAKKSIERSRSLALGLVLSDTVGLNIYIIICVVAHEILPLAVAPISTLKFECKLSVERMEEEPVVLAERCANQLEAYL
jgi:hypothetical protein